MKILRNIDIRVVSVLLAAILWLHAVTEREFTVTFECPVILENLHPELIPASWPLPVRCAVTAKGKDILALRLKGPRIMVDAGNKRVRSLSIRLSESHLLLPFGLKASQSEFQPQELSFRLDRLASRTVLVLPDLIGQPAEGYIVSDSTTAEPCSAKLWGPEKTLAQTDTVFTEPIRIDELRESQRRRARLAVPDTQSFRVEPESVWVALVFEKASERTFHSVPITLTNRGAGYLVSFSPGTVDIRASGPKNALESARPSEIRAFLDLKGLPAGSHQLQAVIELPSRLELISASPSSFEVTIK